MMHLTPIFTSQPPPVLWYCWLLSMACSSCVAVPSPWSPMCAVTYWGGFSWAFQAWLKAVGAIVLSLKMVAWWWWLVVNEVDEEVMDKRWDLPQTGVMSIIGNCRVSASADCWVMNGMTWLDCSTSFHSLFLMQLALSHISHLPDVSNPTTRILECRKKSEDPLSCKFHANRACREREHETWAVRIGGSLEVRLAQGGTMQGVNALRLKRYHHLQRWKNPHSVRATT